MFNVLKNTITLKVPKIIKYEDVKNIKTIDWIIPSN